MEGQELLEGGKGTVGIGEARVLRKDMFNDKREGWSGICKLIVMR